MLRNDIFSVGFVTVCLMASAGLFISSSTWLYGFIILLLSPVLICWMVYSVLKHGKYDGPELGHDEFGYQDKPEI